MTLQRVGLNNNILSMVSTHRSSLFFRQREGEKKRLRTEEGKLRISQETVTCGWRARGRHGDDYDDDYDDGTNEQRSQVEVG